MYHIIPGMPLAKTFSSPFKTEAVKWWSKARTILYTNQRMRLKEKSQRKRCSAGVVGRHTMDMTMSQATSTRAAVMLQKPENIHVQVLRYLLIRILTHRPYRYTSRETTSPGTCTALSRISSIQDLATYELLLLQSTFLAVNGLMR